MTSSQTSSGGTDGHSRTPRDNRRPSRPSPRGGQPHRHDRGSRSPHRGRSRSSRRGRSRSPNHNRGRSLRRGRSPHPRGSASEDGSRSSGSQQRSRPPRAYTPFTLVFPPRYRPVQRDLSATSKSLWPKLTHRFRVRLATVNAFPDPVEVTSWSKREVEEVFAEIPRRLLRFKEDRRYNEFVMKLVCVPFITAFFVLTTHE